MPVSKEKNFVISEVRKQLLSAYAHALEAVDGTRLVGNALAGVGTIPDDAVSVVAIGKVAHAMTLGVIRAGSTRISRGLVITRAGCVLPEVEKHPVLDCRIAGHPVPDAASLAAGDALVKFLVDSEHGENLLFLISGGASSLVEVLPEEIGLDDLQRMNDWLLGSGLEIDEINSVRKSVSQIKGGGLLGYLSGVRTRGLLISDVPGNDPGTIGSGLLVQDRSHRPVAGLPDWLSAMQTRAGGAPSVGQGCPELQVIGTNADALASARQFLESSTRLPVVIGAEYSGNVNVLASDILETIDSLPEGVWIAGGESTVRLPVQPGYGGRNQHLALLIARAIQGREDLAVLVGATDGSDGVTDDAGALVDGLTWQRAIDAGCDPEHALATADSGTCLAAAGDVIHTGATGTNVMDLVIAIKRRNRVLS